MFVSMFENMDRSREFLLRKDGSNRPSQPGGRVEIYEAAPGDPRMEVWLSEGSVWLSQPQIAELFERPRALVTKHLNFAYRDGELDPATTRTPFPQMRREGGRVVTREVLHYNLDAIMAVGFRIRSQPGARFRALATRLLLDYLLRGYAANPERLLEQGTEEMRRSIDRLDRAIARREGEAAAR